MIIGLLLIVVVRGGQTFWPQKLKKVERIDGTFLMGELTKTETYRPEDFVFENIEVSRTPGPATVTNTSVSAMAR